jgi:hypothetical protein
MELSIKIPRSTESRARLLATLFKTGSSSRIKVSQKHLLPVKGERRTHKGLVLEFSKYDKENGNYFPDMARNMAAAKPLTS